MEKKKVKAFFRNQIDSHRKVVCVFDSNVSEEQMKEVVIEYLRENEYDDSDDSAPLHTAEELEAAAEMIVNGGRSIVTWIVIGLTTLICMFNQIK